MVESSPSTQYYPWFFKRTKLGCPIDSLDMVFHSIKEKNTGKIICWKNACVN